MFAPQCINVDSDLQSEVYNTSCSKLGNIVLSAAAAAIVSTCVLTMSVSLVEWRKRRFGIQAR